MGTVLMKLQHEKEGFAFLKRIGALVEPISWKAVTTWGDERWVEVEKWVHELYTDGRLNALEAVFSASLNSAAAAVYEAWGRVALIRWINETLFDG